MKIRTSFVSNSSTSSFIIVGISIGALNITPVRQEKILATLKDKGDSEIRYYEDEGIIGITIADGEHTHEHNPDHITDDIKNAKKEVRQYLREHHIGSKLGEEILINLYIGSISDY